MSAPQHCGIQVAQHLWMSNWYAMYALHPVSIQYYCGRGHSNHLILDKKYSEH